MRPVHVVGQRAARLHAGQSGVGLIEVLVAVLVLSIAFLGIAALQALSLSTNNSAMARSMATIDSYSILDAMRADAASARGGAYNTTATKASACPAVATTASLSNAQLIQWCNQLGADLGKTANTIGAINCSSSGDCTITITFDDSRGGAGGTSAQAVTTRAML
ncbi:type IV pilus modification protein PilV [Rhodanobacter sp. FW510-R12]|nr:MULTISPECIES: type IV pilus modification protein PilV [unclassified Rhodanobacter]KZC16367.1 type IV pilus modification protein PilV [Rhodanobacter sp. FW104-R8]KZC25426.1 type IV pilus modification protein PilV [Rhodanobacter sp. FW510-T8]KZC31380.1 type IV pilus modification protein PilV [Rhodanobacter sp. FW510-R10]